LRALRLDVHSWHVPLHNVLGDPSIHARRRDMASTSAVQPRAFTVSVDEDVLTDLRERLARTRWPDEAPESGWTHGTDLSYLRSLVAHWQDGFDWREQERALNQFEQFTVPLAGTDLHFIHQPGVGPRPLPLLLLNGWPSSVWEYHKVLPLLTDPGRFGGDPADAFTVVAPSLPGYGFSFQPGQRRLGLDETADVLAELMHDVLGYERFVVSGSDWGAYITARLAHAHAQRLGGIHLTLIPMRPEPQPGPAGSPPEEAFRAQVRQWLTEETGYSAIQGTRPQTLTYGLTDSPAGLAAWIVEKFRAWSDCGGDLDSRFTKDELLTNVMIYWVTGAIGSSFWPYYSSRHGDWSLTDLVKQGKRIEVPTAYSVFPGEVIRPFPQLLERVCNLQRFTKHGAGGHFPAQEVPELLAADLRESFRPAR
jgi:microsomal epoxide hydrolase